MRLVIEKTDSIGGKAVIPSSKSHSIRAIFFASLAKGKSNLENVLESEDTKAAIGACRALGANIVKSSTGKYEIEGVDGRPDIREHEINTLNSGTTTNFIASACALADHKVIIDGDHSIRRRTMQPLLAALRNLGAEASSLKNDGCPPIQISGRIEGGRIILDCLSSQYISSLLISCPLIEGNTEIELKNVCERPYIEMTLKWLDELGIKYHNDSFVKLIVSGGQRYCSFHKSISGDWSSATFLIVAAVMRGEEVSIEGLDIGDTQADKQIINHLIKMGARIHIGSNNVVVYRSEIDGCELDFNDIPDALPAFAVLGCYAKGRTIIKNAAHARIKETDRIHAMVEELSKMGAIIEERADGLIVGHSNLRGVRVDGHCDHRVVMALSLAGMIAEGKTIIDTAEAINATFPDYVNMMKSLGAKMHMEEQIR
jgi:3-phosphoshikimate 1-carboxyvinyltransferase